MGSFTFKVSDIHDNWSSVQTTSVEVIAVADKPSISLSLSDGVLVDGGTTTTQGITEQESVNVKLGHQYGDNNIYGTNGTNYRETTSKVLDFGVANAGKTIELTMDVTVAGSWNFSSSYYDDNWSVFVNNEQKAIYKYSSQSGQTPSNYNESTNSSGVVEYEYGNAGENSNFTKNHQTPTLMVTLDENGRANLTLAASTTEKAETVTFNWVKGYIPAETVELEDKYEYTVDIASSLVDKDGSESLSVKIEGVPLNAEFTPSTGMTNLGNGVWELIIPAGQKEVTLNNLKMLVPEDETTFTLKATATATEANDTQDTSSSITSISNTEGEVHNIPDARITVTDITSDDSTTLTKAISHVKYFLSDGTTAKVEYSDGVEIKDPNDPTKFIEEIERLTGSTVTDYYIKAAKNVYTDDGTFYDTFDKKGKLVTDPLTNQVTSGQEYSYNISTNEIYNFNSSSFEYKIVINASIVDTNNEESLNVVVSVPTGAVLSQGTDNSDGTWTINVNNSDLFTTELNVTSSTRIDANEISLKVTSTNENTNESVTNETGADNNNVLMMTGDSIDLEDISLTNKIEAISLEGNGSQTLNLDLSDVIDLTDIDNDLVIKGDLSDKVDLDNTEWTNSGTQEIDGSNYNVYTGLGANSTVKLLIDDDIEITPDI